MPEHGASFEEVVGSMKSGTPLLEMSYTAETFSRVVRTQTGTSDYPMLDLAHQKPESRRQEVSLSLMPDGSLSTIITKKAPNNPINIPTNVLPNTSIPEVNKIVTTNEEMRIYDRNGNELANHPVNIPFQTDWVNQITEMGNNYSAATVNNAILTGQQQNYIQELDDYIANADANNYLVTDHGDDIWTVKEPLSNFGALPNHIQNDYAIHIFNRAENLLLATGVYDEQDVMKSRIMMIYEDTGNGKQLKKFRQEAQETLPSGELAYVETITEFDNLTITLNY